MRAEYRMCFHVLYDEKKKITNMLLCDDVETS